MELRSKIKQGSRRRRDLWDGWDGWDMGTQTAPPTERQLQVLKLWLKGNRQRAIAKELEISPTRVAEILDKYMVREMTPKSWVKKLREGRPDFDVYPTDTTGTGFKKMTRKFKSFEVALEVTALLEADNQ